MNLRRVGMLALLVAFFSPCVPARADMSGGNFSITATRTVINESFSLAGGGFDLSPSAGAPDFGAFLSGGGFDTAPAPVFPLPPVSLAASSLSGAHPYPVPFRPSLGHTKITFTGLTLSVVVTIYTIKGERVRSLVKDDLTSDLDWNPVSNERGESVASGLYLFVIKSNLTGEKKVGKLIIIR